MIRPASLLDRLESRLERLVEGSVGAVFRTPVEPAEIGGKIERAMTAGLVPGAGGRIAPNDYRVGMHPDDLVRFADHHEALCRQLAAWVGEVADERGHRLADRPRVRIEPDPAVPRRGVRVVASVAERSPAERRRDAARDEAALARAIEAATGVRALRAVADLGPGGRRAFLLREPRTTVGRAPGNHVVLDRADVSRRHARFEWRGDGWHVVDLGSTNGTRVNGERVGSAAVAAGDEVALGSVAVRLFRLGDAGNPDAA